MASIAGNLLLDTGACRWLPRPTHRPSPADAAADPRPQLLIDVSIIATHDAGTGIQRVVRQFYLGLLQNAACTFRICPIAAADGAGYRRLPQDFIDRPRSRADATVALSVGPGDVFFGLDLAPRLVAANFLQLRAWCQRGVRIAFMVYDLLPLRQTRWFAPHSTRFFRRWLRTVAATADCAICLSRDVACDVRQAIGAERPERAGLPQIVVVPPATDLHERPESTAVPPGMATPYVLVVGTIEPRKAHGQVLDAFEQLWSRGHPVSLVFAGRRGWQVQELLDRLARHPEKGRRLHWIEAPSDTRLAALYRHSSGVLMASHAEGFGLPVLEALHFGKPVLTRDLPVFREVMGDQASYFIDDSANGLADAIDRWLRSPEQARPDPPCASWDNSVAALLHVLKGVAAGSDHTEPPCPA